MHFKRRGFTLIELLVVIAIIAILAAILFPIFLRAKVLSQRTTCLNNLRQLGTASHMYADLWNDYYPGARVHKDNLHWPNGDWNDGHPYYGNAYLGPRALIPFAKNRKIFFCPSNKYFKTPPYFTGAGSYWCGYLYWGGYLLVDRATGQPKLTRKEVAIKAGEFPNTLLFSDMIVTGTEADGKPLTWNSHVTKEVHGGNILYNDGHAKWKHFQQMQKLVNIHPAGGPSVDFYW